MNEADCQYLEEIGFTGHSLSVSDIIELHNSPESSRFYFCDTFGLQKIQFQKEFAMCSVQNHDHVSYHKAIHSGSCFLAFIGNTGITVHKCSQVLLSRCRYSQCQLGYRLCYLLNGEKECRQKEFLERPSVLLFEDIQGPPPENLWFRSPKPSVRISRHPIHSLVNLKLVEDWCRNHNIPYKYL